MERASLNIAFTAEKQRQEEWETMNNSMSVTFDLPGVMLFLFMFHDILKQCPSHNLCSTHGLSRIVNLQTITVSSLETEAKKLTAL